MPRKSRNIVLTLVAILGCCNCALGATQATISVSSTGVPVSGTGNIMVAFSDSTGKSYSETVAYGAYSSPASLASGMAAMFTRDYICVSVGNCTSGLGAQVITPGSATVTFQLNNGASFGAATVTNLSASFSFNQFAFALTPTISISDIPSSAAYGGSFTATYSYSGNGSPTETVSSSTPSVCIATSNTVSYVGTGTCILQASATAIPGYTAVTGSGQRFTVNKAPLTVTASNASRAYEAANPTFTPVYSGFVNGDTQNVLSGSASLTAIATTSSTLGTYTITVAAGTLAATNYTFNYVNGTLTIIQATPVITWANPLNVLPGTTLSAAQLNAAANVPGSFSYSPAAGALLDSGSQTLSATFTPTDTTNYSTATATATLTVSLAPSAGIITTVAGNGVAGYSGNGGAATSAELDNPAGVALDANGNIYVADAAYGYIRKVNAATGIITTVVGNGSGGYSGDGHAATSTGIGIPVAVTVDASGNIYIGDTYDNYVLKVNATTGIVTKVAGNGTCGYNNDPRNGGDGGAATSAYMCAPFGVSVDAGGNIYIADSSNNRIRKVNTAGTITTVAGNGTGGYSGDNGAAVNAELYIPFGVFLDASGNIYIADWMNDCIRKVNTAGTITTVAGNGTAGYSGDGGAATSAELNAPQSVYVDASDNIYIADGANNRIRKVNAATGIITTVAGNGTAGYFGDGGIATGAELQLVGWATGGVSVGASGTIYISDSKNNRIRAVGPAANALGIAVTTSGSPSVYGSPVTFTATVPSGDTNTVTFFNGSNQLGTATPNNGIASLTISSLAPGVNPITASIAAGGSYPAATSDLIDQVVNQLPSTISISNIPSNAGYGGSFTATYSYSGNGLPSVSSSTPSVCAASDSNVYYLSAGTCTLQAYAPATADYAAVTGSAQSFAVSPPTIDSLSPASGPESTPVTISGRGFGFSPDTTTLAFNGTVANISSWSNTSIVAKVPIGATTGNVVVTANGTASNGAMFTVQATTPAIVSLSASSGNVGLAVTISGSGFGVTKGQSTVTFSGTPAGVLNWSDSSITAIVPSNATTGPVVVTTLPNHQTSNTNVIFTVASGAPCN